MHKSIIILDFGSQYTQVIARRIREFNVLSTVLPFNTSAAVIASLKPAGIILSGGPSSVLSQNAPLPDGGIFKLNIPILGICYGIQLFGHLLGGKVAPSDHREYGHSELEILSDSLLFEGLERKLRVWNSHGDALKFIPEGFSAIATTENSAFAAIEDVSRHFYGLQFHPEVEHSIGGREILSNFVFKICGAVADWKMSSYLDEAVEGIRSTVKDQHVILGLSGGVDSSVAAALIHRAIGKQLTCIFVDTGLLRLNEREEVEGLFKGHFQMNLVTIDASELFLNALKDVSDPEQKRKIIGKLFIQVFEDAVKSVPDHVEFLAQGTIYPDVIESVPIGGNPASLIKSHHNVGGLPETMKLKLLEPLRELFKDEVRALGLELGLPATLLNRHPFPGPGLAIRVMGDIKSEYLSILRKADAIFIDQLRKSGLYDKVWQAFCVFLPVRSVGVMGDERTHDFTIAVRAVNSSDAMTANWAHLPHDFLGLVSSRIINEVKGVSRVVYDISSKPPSTIEWE